MKTNQAWGWLVVGVLAAGLNASYHDGGLRWVHGVVATVGHNSAAVLALASGRTDQFLTEAQLLTTRNEIFSCRLATALARAQTRIAESQAGLDGISARKEAQFARLEANRARVDARIAAQTFRFKFATADFAPVALKALPAPVVCPRVRVNLPKVPMMKMPVAPEIHIETAGSGPV